MEKVKYCVWCGLEHTEEAAVCEGCGKELDAKEHLLREFLINHTKDKLKGDAEESLFEAIKNFLLSHLFSVVVGVSLVAMTAASFLVENPADHIETIDTVSDQVLSAMTAPPTTVETTAPVEYYTITEQDKAEMFTCLEEFVDGLGMIGMTAGNHLYIYWISEELETAIGYDSLLHIYADRVDEVIYPFASVTRNELTIHEDTLTSVPRTKNTQQLMEMGYPVASMEVSVANYDITQVINGAPENYLGTGNYLVTFALENGQWLIVEQISLTNRLEEGSEALQ